MTDFKKKIYSAEKSVLYIEETESLDPIFMEDYYKLYDSNCELIAVISEKEKEEIPVMYDIDIWEEFVNNKNYNYAEDYKELAKEYIEDTEATLKLSNSLEAFKEEKEEMLTMLNTLSEKNFCEMYSIHKIGNTYFMEY